MWSWLQELGRDVGKTCADMWHLLSALWSWLREHVQLGTVPAWAAVIAGVLAYLAHLREKRRDYAKDYERVQEQAAMVSAWPEDRVPEGRRRRGVERKGIVIKNASALPVSEVRLSLPTEKRWLGFAVLEDAVHLDFLGPDKSHWHEITYLLPEAEGVPFKLRFRDASGVSWSRVSGNLRFDDQAKWQPDHAEALIATQSRQKPVKRSERRRMTRDVWMLGKGEKSTDID